MCRKISDESPLSADTSDPARSSWAEPSGTSQCVGNFATVGVIDARIAEKTHTSTSGRRILRAMRGLQWRTRMRGLRLAGLALALAVGLAACTDGAGNNGADAERDEDVPFVLTTFTVLADIAQNVGGEHVRVESLTKVGAEIHGYEPTPADVRRAVDADLVLDNGLNLEAWFERFLADVKVPRITLSQGVEPIDIAEDAYAGKPNPHAWMSPQNVEIYVDNIVEAFTQLQPDHAADFERNAAHYTQELREVAGRLDQIVANLPENQRALVTCEGAFSYLARDAGLTEAYIWPVNAEQEATPGQITRAIEFVKANDVPAVFCESTVSNAPMMQVVEATDAEFGGTLYVDSLSEPDGPVPTYLDLITHDVNTIIDGLTGGAS